MNNGNLNTNRVLLSVVAVAAIAVLPAGCVSYEPAILVPAVTLSAEEVSLVSGGEDVARVDFGVDVAVNESDSLFNVEVLPGVRVRSVTANGAAEAAGIEAGDTILGINGTETNHPDALLTLQQRQSTDNQYQFTVQRNTVVFEATVIGRQLTANPPPVILFRVDPLATRAAYGTALVNIGEPAPIAAATVQEIYPHSPLPGAGITVGDTILALNGETLNSAQDLISRLNREHALGDEVSVTRFRDGNLSDIRFQLWDPGRRISRISVGPLFRYESSLSPDSESVSVLDLWLFSLYSYRQLEGERSHSLLGLINFSSGSGELLEESN